MRSLYQPIVLLGLMICYTIQASNCEETLGRILRIEDNTDNPAENVTVYREGPDGTEKKVYYQRTNRGLHGSSADPVKPFYPQDMMRINELKGKKVLDAGTGGGNLVTDLRSEGVDAIGVDLALSPTQKQHPDIFIQADMANMPFKKSEFDYVYSTWSVFSYEKTNIPLLKSVLKEFQRVLKVNGKIRLAPIYDKENTYIQEVLTPLLKEVPGLELSRIWTRPPTYSSNVPNYAIEIIRVK